MIQVKTKVATLFTSRTIYFIVPSLLLLICILFEWFSILSYNNGIFSYSLDDPYIHLSLAQHIGAGEYSFTHDTHSSPSSSILWPFILTPFSGYSWFVLTPLFLNTIFSLFILWVFISLCLQIENVSTFKWSNIILFCLLIPALNLLGSIFIGMEHTLQMLLSVLLVYGLISESREGNFPLWLSVVIVMGPLIRYENLALSIPGLIFLYYRGHQFRAICTFSLLVCLLGSFSLFLIHIGEPPVASAILTKLSMSCSNSVENLMSMHIKLNLMQRQFYIFICFLFGFIGLILFSKITSVQKQLLITISSSIIAQLFFGTFTWFSRYELYLYAVIWLLTLYFYFSYAELLKQFLGFTFLIIALIFTSIPYIVIQMLISKSANNIFSQQYQMRKFVIDWVKSPVAVNDIGWVSFNNSHYVLDLWGLGNYQMYQKRRLQKSSQWMVQPVAQSHIKLVMIYNSWFLEPPKTWKLLGCLFLTGTETFPVEKTVNFYATDNQYFSELKEKLLLFKKELPKGVDFRFDCHY